MPEMTIQQATDLARQYQRAGQLGEAEAIYRQVVSRQPGRHDLLQQLAQLAHQAGRVEESLELMRRAVAMAPGAGDYHSNLAMLLSTLGRFEEAIPEYRQALAINPNHPEPYNNYGNLLRETGRAAEAEAAFRRAIELGGSESARWNLSFMLLIRGAFAEGWPAYEARLRMAGFPIRKFAQPMWDGGDLRGRTILLHWEQGLGDTFNFIRYAPLVKQRGGRVVMLCQREVFRLLAHQNHLGVEKWVADGEDLPAFDVHRPLLSLPGIFGTTFETIPREVPYLFADATMTQAWRERLAPEAGPKIGLVWGGSPTPIHNRKRSTTLAALAPLAEASGVTFVSLQKGDPAAEAKFPPHGLKLLDYTPELKDFADTAALISALDLVISIDTGVAHLAGALAKPTWVLLPFVPDWRWFNDRADSPWYPTTHLFRQSRLGDWTSPIRAAAEELKRRR
jgi:Tfp pilus assembly protein PilF